MQQLHQNLWGSDLDLSSLSSPLDLSPLSAPSPEVPASDALSQVRRLAKFNLAGAKSQVRGKSHVFVPSRSVSSSSVSSVSFLSEPLEEPLEGSLFINSVTPGTWVMVIFFLVGEEAATSTTLHDFAASGRVGGGLQGGVFLFLAASGVM
jgi:hypothetical protein